jgi:hypothetical protein
MNANNIHAGRIVHYFAGYGGIDGKGVIVKVYGTPNPEPAKVYGGVMRVIRPNDCTVDVILFDGRRINRVNQCGIDAPGIGIKLTDEVVGEDVVAAMPAVAAKYDADRALEAVLKAQRFEAAEAARVITDAPVFYWNGIKDAKGANLQKCYYSEGPFTGYPEGTISIYGRDYCGFSQKVRACFAVQNDTDTQVDYFDNDRIRVIPSHPLYNQVKAAMEAGKARREKRAA